MAMIVYNRTTTETTVALEPSGDGIQLPAGHEVEIVLEADFSARDIDVEYRDGGVSIFGPFYALSFGLVSKSRTF